MSPESVLSWPRSAFWKRSLACSQFCCLLLRPVGTSSTESFAPQPRPDWGARTCTSTYTDYEGGLGDQWVMMSLNISTGPLYQRRHPSHCPLFFFMHSHWGWAALLIWAFVVHKMLLKLDHFIHNVFIHLLFRHGYCLNIHSSVQSSPPLSVCVCIYRLCNASSIFA